MKLKDLYEQWMILKKATIKKSSVSQYQWLWKNHVSKYGEYNYSDFTNAFMQQIILELLDKGLSYRTTEANILLIKNILKYASYNYNLPMCAWNLKYPTSSRRGKEDLQVYDEKEIKQIVQVAFNELTPTSISVIFALFTGIRVAELCALKLGDIDVVEKKVVISKQLQRVCDAETNTSEIIISTPKTTSSYREIPVPDEIIKKIKVLKKIYDDDCYLTSFNVHPVESRVFSARYKSFIKHNVKLGRCIKMHGLRHTFATSLLRNKIDIKTISSLLGHSDVSTTLNVYVHTSLDVKKSATKTLNKLFV